MADDNQEQQASGVEENLPAVTPEAQIEALTTERDQLVAEKAELKDRLLRTMADFENFRRRAERDRSDYVQYAAMEIVRSLIPILDDFRRATKVETADKEYAKGVEMIEQRLLETLKKAGLDRDGGRRQAVRSESAPSGRPGRIRRAARTRRSSKNIKAAIISKESFCGWRW